MLNSLFTPCLAISQLIPNWCSPSYLLTTNSSETREKKLDEKVTRRLDEIEQNIVKWDIVKNTYISQLQAMNGDKSPNLSKKRAEIVKNLKIVVKNINDLRASQEQLVSASVRKSTIIDTMQNAHLQKEILNNTYQTTKKMAIDPSSIDQIESQASSIEGFMQDAEFISDKVSQVFSTSTPEQTLGIHPSHTDVYDDLDSDLEFLLSQNGISFTSPSSSSSSQIPLTSEMFPKVPYFVPIISSSSTIPSSTPTPTPTPISVPISSSSSSSSSSSQMVSNLF